jgi:thiol:disulfide interchange protein DsbA
MYALAAEPREGVDYVRIAPHPALRDKDKIEVIEFFYYGCDACSRLETRLQVWLSTVAPDVFFLRVPALRRTAWVPLARLFFALEQLGQLERLHAQVYRAIHHEGLNLGDTSEVYDWAEKVGLDRSRLQTAIESDAVSAQVQRAHDTTLAYAVRATPSFAVDGKYLTSGNLTGSLEALLPTIDNLLDKVRSSRRQQ